MKLSKVKFGTVIQIGQRYETAIVASTHGIALEYKNGMVIITDKQGNVVLVPLTNVAYMSGEPNDTK